MITSDRKFGVEIEFTTATTRQYAKIQDTFNGQVVPDGSLRDAGVIGGEYVSPVLSGSKGADEIDRVCTLLKKMGASGEHPATSVHVHLDGKDKRELVKSKSRFTTNNDVIVGISNRLASQITSDKLEFIIHQRRLPSSMRETGRYFETVIDNVFYFSCAQITKHPSINYTYYQNQIPDRFLWLRNVMYFYTIYSQVMESMVSNSRRFGNMYCIPLGESYELKDIEATKNIDELRHLWYKGNEQHTHYDDSRYHNVNLHSYFHRPGTVEIRSHGGTIDQAKIMLWVKLHQKIVDKLETVELNDIKFTGDQYENFLDFIEEPILQEYVKRLLGYYSGIKVNK